MSADVKLRHADDEECRCCHAARAAFDAFAAGQASAPLPPDVWELLEKAWPDLFNLIHQGCDNIPVLAAVDAFDASLRARAKSWQHDEPGEPSREALMELFVAEGRFRDDLPGAAEMVSEALARCEREAEEPKNAR